MITTTQIIHDKAGNVSSKILTVLDKDGTIVELVDMLAYQAQQELEQKQQAFLDSLSASRTLDDGGMTMMAMSSPEAPTSRLDEFGYDHLGNRTTVYLNKGVMAQETQEYAHNSVNQYSTINSTILGLPLGGAVEYDDNGNLATDKEGYGYSYDYRNRIEEIEEVVQFSYDALGRRIRKTDCQSNITTYYIYDPDNRIIAQYTQPLNDEAALDRTFVYGNDLHEVLAMYLARHEGNPADWDAFLEFVDAWLCTDPNDACYNGAYDHNSDNIVNLKDFAYYSGIWNMPSNRESNWYYLHDVQGSVMGVIGGRLNRPEDREFYTYDVYGNPSSLSAIGNPFMFHGKFVASTQPLVYSRFYRDYQPSLGRWMQFDPIGYADGVNLYEFVSGNPINYFDIDGLKKVYITIFYHWKTLTMNKAVEREIKRQFENCFKTCIPIDKCTGTPKHEVVIKFASVSEMKYDEIETGWQKKKLWQNSHYYLKSRDDSKGFYIAKERKGQAFINSERYLKSPAASDIALGTVVAHEFGTHTLAGWYLHKHNEGYVDSKNATLGGEFSNEACKDICRKLGVHK